MKHAIPHHAVLAGLIFCLAKSVAVAQWSPGQFSDVQIKPVSQSQPFTLTQMAPNVNVPILNNTGLEIKNPLGGIYLTLPAANGQPSTGGTFGVFKGAESMLYLQPGTTKNIMSVNADSSLNGTLSVAGATSISGSLTVNGAVSFTGAGNFSIGSGTGAITVTGNNTGVSATGSNAVAIGGLNSTASGEGSVVLGGRTINYTSVASGIGSAVIGGGSQYAPNVASGEYSTIIGSGQSTANSAYTSVIGALAGKILGTGSHYSTVIGGGGNQMTALAGDYNAIIAGGNNRITTPPSMVSPTRGGFASAIVAGLDNEIIGGHYGQVILGGDANKIHRTRGSAIVGGRENQILSRDPSDPNYGSMGDDGQNVILGGRLNAIQQDSARCLVSGNFNIAGGYDQVVMGRVNVVDSTKLLILGNGYYTDNPNGTRTRYPSNALTVDFNGNVDAKGKVKAQTLEASSLTITSDTSDISMGVFTAQ